jgi:DNA-binding NarL/FixJ family response regulator
MNNRILIIDDEVLQAENLKKALTVSKPNYSFDVASNPEEIDKKIRETYFNVAVVDLRMDKFPKNGVDIIKEILDVNPFARIIVVSAFIPEYLEDINELIKTGRVAAIHDKEKFDSFKEKVGASIDKVIADFEKNKSSNQAALQALFSEAKNEKDAYQKGVKFEYFVTMLFSQMGFNHLESRTRDKSQNEVDIIIRNDVSDLFFSKFKPYILIECKNTSDDVGKNDFILFKTKLENTKALSDLGFLVTSASLKRTTYLEAMRVSDKDYKIIFISNVEIAELISSDDGIEALKKIIDKQVKDN